MKLKKISSGETIYELESTLVNDFDYSDGSLLVNIEKLDLALKNAHIFLPDVKYSSIFDTTVLRRIQSKEFQDSIRDFIAKVDSIIKLLIFLKKVFLHFLN